MKFCYFTILCVAVLLLVVNHGHCQKINFSNKKTSATQTTSKKSLKDNSDKNIKSKNFKDENGLRAASTCWNCECQCDSYGWKDKNGRFIGNCESPDNTGAKFCYISGRALRTCRDIKQSEYRQDSFNGQKKFYSYEACATPRKNECYRLNQQYNQNCGDGDYNNGGGNNNGYPNNNNGYPNNNNGYPNNKNGYPNNNNNGYPSNNNNGYPNNNNGYPSNNGNTWTLQSQIPGLGSPRIDEDKETSITFGEK